MGFLVFDDHYRTIQETFDFSLPRFGITSSQSAFYPFDSWIVMERLNSNNNLMTVGETVVVAKFNSFTGAVDEYGAATYTYEGLVDMDSDGWLDSVMISRFGAKTVLTSENAYLDFTPLRTDVFLNRVGTSTEIWPANPVSVKTDQFDFAHYGKGRGENIRGTNGEDALFGMGGKDKIHGRSGADLMDGGTGNDKLFGGAGADAIWGGKGRDTLKGGAGADDFWMDTRHGFDVIRGFDRKDDIVINAGEKAFRGVGKGDVKIIDKRKFDVVKVDGDTVAKVYGSDVAQNDVDIFL